MFGRRLLVVAACTLAAGLALVSISDSEGFRRYLKLRDEMNGLQARNAEFRTQNASLAHQVAALRADPKALERAAREELGFIAPGEVVINLE